MLFREFKNSCVLKRIVWSLRFSRPITIHAANGRPCLSDNFTARISLANVSLRKKWMQFHLIDRGHNFTASDQVLQMLWAEITDPDCAHPPFGQKFFQCSIRTDGRFKLRAD